MIKDDVESNRGNRLWRGVGRIISLVFKQPFGTSHLTACLRHTHRQLVGCISDWHGGGSV